MTAIILEFQPRSPERIEVRRDGNGWWVFDRDHGWRQITEAVARVLTQLANTITEEERS
jgi:sugar (pentulose or hexulose) kinase